MKYSKEEIAKTRVASHLIEPPAAEVIGELLDEIERLTAELAELRTVLKSKEIIIDNQEKRINELAERLLKK